MRQTYQHALCTFVVLSGDGKLSDELLFATGQLDVAPLHDSITPFSPKHPISAASLEVLSDSEFRESSMKVVDNVIFSRGWVYQEIVSSSKPYLASKTTRIEWDIFAAVFALCLLGEAQTQEDRLMT